METSSATSGSVIEVLEEELAKKQWARSKLDRQIKDILVLLASLREGPHESFATTEERREVPNVGDLIDLVERILGDRDGEMRTNELFALVSERWVFPGEKRPDEGKFRSSLTVGAKNKRVILLDDSGAKIDKFQPKKGDAKFFYGSVMLPEKYALSDEK